MSERIAFYPLCGTVYHAATSRGSWGAEKIRTRDKTLFILNRFWRYALSKSSSNACFSASTVCLANRTFWSKRPIKRRSWTLFLSQLPPLSGVERARLDDSQPAGRARRIVTRIFGHPITYVFNIARRITHSRVSPDYAILEPCISMKAKQKPSRPKRCSTH